MEQKRKVKSLMSVSETGEMWIFSKFLIALSCIFCFWTILMLALCVSYVDAANPLYSLYSWWVEEKSETLYRLDFTKSGSLDIPEAHIYMKSNAVWKNNLYIEPYPIVVQKKWLLNRYEPIWSINNSYLNFLWWDKLEILSPNISIIWWYDLTVESNNSNATIFGGGQNRIHSSSASSSVIVWWYKNNINWTNGVIVWWHGNEIFGNNSFLLWWEGKSISEESSNVIVAWIGVNTPRDSQLNNVFAYSEGSPFSPQSSNAFYVNVRKWLWLKMQAPGWVASSGAVSFGSVKSIWKCDNVNIWLMWLSWNCLYGCSEAGWQELWCFEEVRLTGDDTLWACRGKVYDNATTRNKKEADRYERCFSGYEEMYQNVKFETSLWTGEKCPEEPGIWKNPCIYKCADGYHYYEDPEWKDSWCKKDCELPWDSNEYKKHREVITWYSLSGVVCEETDKALWCEGVKAILQCNDGKWEKIGWSGKAEVYGKDGKINYNHKSCETKENKCNTWVYQYTNTGILNWVNLWKCTNHRVDENLCVSIDTIYSWRCYKNHTLVSLNWGVCKTWSNTVGCWCKPNQKIGECTKLPDRHAIAVKTWFIQTATGDSGRWDPSEKIYVPYSWGNPNAECTFRCENGYSPYRNSSKKKYECLSNCEYNGVTYENGQTISWYEKGFVTCPNLCKPKDLVCHDGKWEWWTTWCITTDQVCSGFNFTKKIDNADCKACIKYKWSFSATCTTGNTLFKCTCYNNYKSWFYVLSGNECVPQTRATNCTWSMPTGNVSFPYWKTFKQTWSGWLKKWWPEESKYHLGTWECGFFCNSGSSYIEMKNKCEWNECIDNDFGTGSYLYPNSSNGIIGNTKSVLYWSSTGAHSAYDRWEKCIYFCDVCYNKVEKPLSSPKCEPQKFNGTFWCKNNAWVWNQTGDSQEFTFQKKDKISRSCSDISGYTFVWWSTIKNSTGVMFTWYLTRGTDGYKGCSSSNFYAVYRKNSFVCSSTPPNFAELVPWSATTWLEERIDYKLYKSVEAASWKACAYVCDKDHQYYESGGVAKCRYCSKTLLSDQSICVDDIVCDKPGFPTKYYDTKEKRLKCTWEFTCRGKVPANAKEPENDLYVWEQGDFGGIAWYCWKNYWKGCHFECDEWYECSIKNPGGYLYLNGKYFSYASYSAYRHEMWLPISLNFSKDSKNRYPITTGNVCINSNACTRYGEVIENFRWQLIHSGVQLYWWTREWTFITWTRSSVQNKLDSNKDDCLLACEDGSMYVTGATLQTREDNKTKFCWKKCARNEIYDEYWICEECDHTQKPDRSLLLPIEKGDDGNAVQCIDVCEDYEKYDYDTESCVALCDEDEYYYEDYRWRWGWCSSCNGQLTWWNGVVYTGCIKEETPSSPPSTSCPSYYHKQWTGCVKEKCSANEYLDTNWYCYECDTELTDWSGSLDEYLDCRSCGNWQHWDWSDCVYDECNATCEEPTDPCQYFSSSYWCTSCPFWQEPGWKKGYGNNYTKCVNICGVGRTYRTQKNPQNNNYCWKSIDAECPDWRDPIQDSDGQWYCRTD